MSSAPPDFFISFSTFVAYQNDVRAIADDLHRRFRLPESKRMDIANCLQEAYINAIVHGNMEIEGHSLSLDSFDSYYATIEARLREALYRERMVTISAWNSDNALTLSIRDEGKGFSLPDSHSDSTLPQGRGLFIIQSLADRVWVGDDRRTLFMTFNCPR